MPDEKLSNYLSQKGSQINIDQIFCGYLDAYLSRGLRVLTICNDGSGRSATVAETLNSIGIPSVRLRGGLKQFEENIDLNQSIAVIQSMINTSPNIAVILTPEEIRLYHGFLSNLRSIKYPTSTAAINSLSKMES